MVDANSPEDKGGSYNNNARGVQPIAFLSPKKLFKDIISLATGEALLFTPNAIINLKLAEGSMRKAPIYLGYGILKLCVREYITQDSSKSIIAR